MIYLVVTSDFPSPTTWRGAYNYDFVRALERTGLYDVRVFVPGNGDDYDYQGVHVYRFKRLSPPSGILPYLFNRQNETFFLEKLKAVGVNLADVAVCHAHTALLAHYAVAVQTREPKCRTILHHHSPAAFGLHLCRLGMGWFNRFLTYFPLKRSLEAIDLHVFVSMQTERSFRLFPQTDWSCYKSYRRSGCGLSFLPSAKIKRSLVLPNGVDTAQFNANGRHQHDGFVIGCIGNFIEWKDQLTLLKAMNLIRDQLGDWKLRLVGSGPFLSRCRQYVKAHRLEEHVSFEQEVDHTQLPEFYRSLDLFVLPSYFEAFGCVFTEAWSCGTPFITCEGQGMADIVSPEERKKWFCRVKDEHDLAEKILNFYRDRSVQLLADSVEIDQHLQRFLEALDDTNH